jgi:ABC-type glycerol-3-phosphate transport system substrate-binding protein
VKETVEVESTVEVEVEKIVVEVEVPVEVEKIVEVETLVEVEREVVRIAGEPSWDPPDFSGREFLVWGLAYDPHVEAYHRLAGKFSEYTGATFTVEPQDWPIEVQIVTGMAAGIVPDVVCIMGQRIGGLVKQGVLAPLDDLVYAATGCDIDSWFGPVAIQAYQYEGETWGVPTEGNNVSGISNARFDVLEEAGVSDLWPSIAGRDGFADFEEMWALGEALALPDGERWGISSEGWYAPQMLGIMRTLGVDWWDPQTRTFAFDTDEALEAMHLLNYRPIFELGLETHLGESSTESMLARKVGICNGNVAMPGTGQTLDPPIDIDSVGFPSALPGREALYVGEGGWGFCAPTQAENPDIGIALLQYITTYEGQKEYSRIYGGLMSSAYAVNSDPEIFPPGVVGDAMKRSSKVQERTVYYGQGFGPIGEMTGIITAASEKVRVGEALPAEVMPDIQEQMIEMLTRWDAEQ